MKAVICIHPAPLRRRAAARGNATKPGMSVTEPMAAAARRPHTPESEPISLVMVSGLSMASAMPMIRSTDRNCGSMFSKDFHAFFNTWTVFFRSLINEKARPAPASPYKIYVNIQPPSLPDSLQDFFNLFGLEHFTVGYDFPVHDQRRGGHDAISGDFGEIGDMVDRCVHA